MTPRPLWRWALFCLALELHRRLPDNTAPSRAAAALFTWCVLPGWLGFDFSDDANEVLW